MLRVSERDLSSIVALGTAVLAVATISLWRFAARQAVDTKESIEQASMTATAARKSADVAEKTLVATQRPWISFKDARIVEPVTFDENGARISVTFVLENTGHSPAQSIWLNVLTFDMAGNLADATARQAKEIEDIKLSESRRRS